MTLGGSCWSWLEGKAPAARLGLLRAAIGSYALWYVGTRFDLIARLARGDPSLYEPVGLFRVSATPLDPALADAMVLATLIAGGLFVLGALYRISGPLFAVLLLLTLCYRNSWSMVYHSHNLVVWHVLILGIARAADGFSVDALFRRARVPISARYGWPIALICAVTAACYFLAGVAKILGPTGLGWASGQLLREQIATDVIRKQVLGDSVPAAAYAIYDHVWMFTAMGILTLVVEIGAPLFLASGRLRRLWAVAAWLMHWGIFVIMGIRFRYQLSFVMFLPFFHVERAASLLRNLGGRLRGESGRPRHQPTGCDSST